MLKSELADLSDYLQHRKTRFELSSTTKFEPWPNMVSRFKALLNLYEVFHGIPFISPIDGDGDWIMEDSMVIGVREKE